MVSNPEVHEFSDLELIEMTRNGNQSAFTESEIDSLLLELKNSGQSSQGVLLDKRI